MPFYKHYSQDDVNLGDAYENAIKPKLEQLFGPLTQRSKEMNRNEVFDFSNDQVYIDVKRRRNTKTKYPTTMVGENKVIQGLQHQVYDADISMGHGTYVYLTCGRMTIRSRAG